MDPYFAVAYFQRGVSNFIKNKMEAAYHDFDQAYQVSEVNQIDSERLIRKLETAWQ